MKMQEMNKKRLFFDMDGVLVDFQTGIDKQSNAKRIRRPLRRNTRDLRLDGAYARSHRSSA